MKTKMSSREQLELAAIAARLKYIKPTDDYDGSQGLMLCNEHGFPTRNWNPLADNGDAFELMVRMRLRLDFTGASFDVIAANPRYTDHSEPIWLHLAQSIYHVDQFEAARHVIVYAVARIGKRLLR